MEPTGPSKDETIRAPTPKDLAQSEASLPSNVPIVSTMPSVPWPQAVPQSTAVDPEPLEPVRKGPRPLPQPKHPISREAQGRNGTFEKAMPPQVVEIADEEKKERTEEEREETQEEEVDYDDDNDDNEDGNGPDKEESEADEKVDSEPEMKDSPSASQQVIDELKTKGKTEAPLAVLERTFTKQKLYEFVKLFSTHFADLSYQPN